MEELTNKLHAQIMNLPCGIAPVPPAFRLASSAEVNWADGYKQGHRDARHAAAELVSAALSESQPVARVGSPFMGEGS